MFIAFEGLDGSGTTTQARLLAGYLRRAGRRVVTVAEPGTTPVGQRVRAVLLDRTLRISPQAELLLYLAARAQVTSEVIRPALEGGAAVIADRYALSSVAYQGYGRGLEVAWVHRLNAWATQGLRPDLTLFLDVPPQEAARRRHGREREEDRLEAEDIRFFRRVRAGYLKEIRALPGGHVLDGLLPAAELAAEVARLVGPLLDG